MSFRIVYLTLFAIELLSFSGARVHAAPKANLIVNGGFETGIQFWKTDGRIVTLQEGNKVLELKASKSRMRELSQEFKLGQLQEVEIVFRARSINYQGPGIRVAIHVNRGGSILHNKRLNEDGSWTDIKIGYVRASAGDDRRTLNISTLLGTGEVQIDDVEVRERSITAKDPEPAKPIPAVPQPPAKPMVAIPQPPVKPIAAVVQPPPMPVKEFKPVIPEAFASLEQLIKFVSPNALAKLQNPATADTALSEINTFLSGNMGSKVMTIRAKLEKAEEIPQGANRFRVKILDEPTPAPGINLPTRVWAYFKEDSIPDAAKLKPGSFVTLSGAIGRCEISSKDGFRLNIDLQRSKLQ